MPLPLHSLVRLLSDRYRGEGVGAGATGTIVEVHDAEAYEVEFSDPDGITVALLALPQDGVEPIAATPAALIRRTGN